MRADIATPSSHQADAFDRLLDVLAEEVVERFVAELEANDLSVRGLNAPEARNARG